MNVKNLIRNTSPQTDFVFKKDGIFSRETGRIRDEPEIYFGDASCRDATYDYTWD